VFGCFVRMTIQPELDVTVLPSSGCPAPAGLIVGTLAGCHAVGVLSLARPSKGNAFDASMWDGFPKASDSCVYECSSQVTGTCSPLFCCPPKQAVVEARASHGLV
jgi:hypothetical protein